MDIISNACTSLYSDNLCVVSHNPHCPLVRHCCMTHHPPMTYLICVKYHTIKALKSIYLYYKRCCKCCPYTCTHTPYCLIRMKFSSWINNLEMPVSCARRLSDFCGVCFNLSPTLSSFSLVRTWHILASLLSRSDPVDLTLLIGLQIHLMLETVFPGNLQQKFL
jgi:hypothetical protein